MKKRILALSVAAALVVGTLASCTSSTDEEESSSVEARDISLVMWASEDDLDFVKEYAEKWADEYAEANEDVNSVTVDVQIIGEDVATENATKDLAAAADVFGVANDQLSTLASANAIYAMPSDVVDEIREIVGDAATESTLYDGTYYGFPYAPNTAEVLYYNTSMYTEDEVKSLNTMVEKDLDGVANLIVTDGGGWNGMTWAATAGIEWFTGSDPTICTLNNENVTAVLTWLSEHAEGGDKTIQYFGSADDAYALLADGKAAALFYGAWASESVENALGDNFGVAELPTLTVDGVLEDEHMVCFGGSKLYVINAQTEEPEAALSLASYFLNEDVQLARYEERSQTPTALALSENETIQENAVVAAELAQGEYTINNDPTASTAGYWDNADALFSGIITGDIAAADIQDELDTFVAALFASLGVE